MQGLASRISEWNHRRIHRRREKALISLLDSGLYETTIPPVQENFVLYQYWIDHFDTLTSPVLAALTQRLEALRRRPLISVVMPVFNPERAYLEQAVRSVMEQLYPDWELCIANDASTVPATRAWLDDLARLDKRIKVVHRSSNGHISEASNSALAMASGEFVALLDQDDLLRPHALLLAAEAMNRVPDAGVLYSDEDKIDLRGSRSSPYFKSDWNAHLFRSHNMVSHLGLYRRSLVARVGGFRKGYEGSQDYDLALRCTELLQRHQIVHIPFVLYHWRIHEASTANGVAAKPYAVEAGRKALQDHLGRTGIQGRVHVLDFGYRVEYGCPPPAPSVSVVMPAPHGAERLHASALNMLRGTRYRNVEIVTVGATGPAGTHTRIRHLSCSPSASLAERVNAAARECGSDYLCIVSEDVADVSPDWLHEMVALSQVPRTGAVGARVLSQERKVVHAGLVLSVGDTVMPIHRSLKQSHCGYMGRARLTQEFSAVSHACLLVRRDLFLRAGGFDERLPQAYCDVDLCLKLNELGYQTAWTPQAELQVHQEPERTDHASAEAARLQEWALLKQKWAHYVRHDPAYNPSLTAIKEDFGLAFPPRVSLLSSGWLQNIHPGR
jgi:glycosyltransferase involved in cell wall biosynthesis